jgi:hypothetical protein
LIPRTVCVKQPFFLRGEEAEVVADLALPAIDLDDASPPASVM